MRDYSLVGEDAWSDRLNKKSAGIGAGNGKRLTLVWTSRHPSQRYRPRSARRRHMTSGWSGVEWESGVGRCRESGDLRKKDLKIG